MFCPFYMHMLSKHLKGKVYTVKDLLLNVIFRYSAQPYSIRSYPIRSYSTKPIPSIPYLALLYSTLSYQAQSHPTNPTLPYDDALFYTILPYHIPTNPSLPYHTQLPTPPHTNVTKSGSTY